MAAFSASSADRARQIRGLTQAGDLLREQFGEFVVSKYRLRQAEGIWLVRENRESGHQSLGFTSRPFVLCGLPIRRPPAGQLLYERRNGHFRLQITGHPEFGLPFGQDRLVPIFLATLAAKQQSQTIRFKSAAELLDTFGMAKGGKEYRRLIAAFERIFGATIFFGTDSMKETAHVVHRSRFNFMREAKIWYNRDPAQMPLGEEFENTIMLSDEFYTEVMAHPIHADMEAVKVFAAAPAVLDLFLWLAYRCFTAKGPEAIPIFGEAGLVRQLGSTEYSRPRRFRAEIEKWLKEIKAAWPTCPARIGPGGRMLLIDSARAIRSVPPARDGMQDFPCRVGIDRWEIPP